MAEKFKGEQFTNQLTKDISDISAKIKAEYFLKIIGLEIRDTNEQFRTGRDVICGPDLPESLKDLTSIDGETSWEATNRLNPKSFRDYLWNGIDECNIPERRYNNQHGAVKIHTAIMEFSHGDADAVIRKNGVTITPIQKWLDINFTEGQQNKSYFDLNADDQEKILDYIEDELNFWLEKGAQTVIWDFQDILANSKTGETGDGKSICKKMPASYRIRFENFKRIKN